MKTFVLLLLAASAAWGGEMAGRAPELFALADGSQFTGTLTRVEIDGVTIMNARGVQKISWPQLADQTRAALENERLAAVREQRVADFQKELDATLPARIGSKQLAAAYEANELKASSLFDGTILVSGTVTEMSFTADKFPAIMLEGGVCCVFDVDSQDTLAEFNIGDDVEIGGVCVGKKPTIFSRTRSMLMVDQCQGIRIVRTAAKKANDQRRAQMEADAKAQWEADRARYAQERAQRKRYRAHLNRDPF